MTKPPFSGAAASIPGVAERMRKHLAEFNAAARNAGNLPDTAQTNNLPNSDEALGMKRHTTMAGESETRVVQIGERLRSLAAAIWELRDPFLLQVAQGALTDASRCEFVKERNHALDLLDSAALAYLMKIDERAFRMRSSFPGALTKADAQRSLARNRRDLSSRILAAEAIGFY
jgi:hypothetical protein